MCSLNVSNNGDNFPKQHAHEKERNRPEQTDIDQVAIEKLCKSYFHKGVV